MLCNDGGAVTLLPGAAAAAASAKSFVNGKQATGATTLVHGDRVIFGSANFFRYTDPAEAARQAAAAAAAAGPAGGDTVAAADGEAAADVQHRVVDWEFAMNERVSSVAS